MSTLGQTSERWLLKRLHSAQRLGPSTFSKNAPKPFLLPAASRSPLPHPLRQIDGKRNRFVPLAGVAAFTSSTSSPRSVSSETSPSSPFRFQPSAFLSCIRPPALFCMDDYSSRKLDLNHLRRQHEQQHPRPPPLQTNKQNKPHRALARTHSLNHSLTHTH